MKLIKKSALQFVGGRLITSDGEVVSPARLVEEVNELAELRQLVDFIKANAAKIDSSREPVIFKVERPTAPAMTTSRVVATPLNDEAEAAAKARAEEFLDAQNVKDIDGHLARYSELAKFFAQDYIEVVGNYSTTPMLIDPLLLTKEQVVELIEEYREPDVFRLSKLVRIDFS